MPIRLIHLGVGGRGRWPVRRVLDRTDFESVALVDVNEDNLRSAREDSGLPQAACYRSLGEAIEGVEADAVVVITPPHMHADQCLQAVRAGKHVLVEKPFTKSLEEACRVLREADAIVVEEIEKAGLYRETSQSFAVLLPVQSVGVMGDARTYDNAIAIRSVDTNDFMTADWSRLPYDLLARMSSRIINEVKGVNRVTYDITSKPPGTIEWE